MLVDHFDVYVLSVAILGTCAYYQTTSENNSATEITARTTLELAYKEEANNVGMDLDGAINEVQSTTARIHTVMKVSNGFYIVRSSVGMCCIHIDAAYTHIVCLLCRC
jgi:hypothetical protein